SSSVAFTTSCRSIPTSRLYHLINGLIITKIPAICEDFVSNLKPGITRFFLFPSKLGLGG
ncbi:MAG: hypothetical protein KJ831_21350, partial [Candidatus Eisenbacteria bacterium]|nr:hypothetical protein [Candidatus Eisenbacteria bacterium]